MLKSRLAVGLGFVAVALGGILAPGVYGAVLFLALCVVLGVVAMDEFFRMAADGRAHSMRDTSVLATVLFCCAIALDGTFDAEAAARGGIGPGGALEILVAAGFLLSAFVSVFRSERRRDALSALFVAVAGFGIVTWTLTFILRLYFSHGLGMPGRFLLGFLLAVTKMGDVGAYVVGSWTAARPAGNHKIAPRLSPKKSWEGLIAGILTSILTAALLNRILGTYLNWRGMPVLGVRSACFLGAVLAVLGFAGDLAESVLKRVAGSKDSGRVPGLGGVLDMLDSLIFAAPFFYAWVRLAAFLQNRSLGML